MRNPYRVFFAGLIAGAAVLMLAACSGIKTYSAKFPKNLHVVTHAASGSNFKSVSAELDVHAVDEACHTHYMGRIYLDEPALDVGIPTNKLLYLDFIFASKRFMSTTVNAVRYTTLLTPRDGYNYNAKVTYESGVYGVVITETRNGKVVRTVPRMSLESCRIT